MRSFRLTALALALSLPTAAYLSNQVAYAQNTVSGDILGSVTDPSGAAIPGASVTLVGTSTGSSAKFTTNAGGQYHFSFLKPGAYKVTVTAPNFSTTTLTVSVSQGSTTPGDVKLSLGKTSVVVEVGADTVPLLQTEDAQLSTTFNTEQVQALPNPGGDITYYAQTAPGVVMNTGGGYGNFSVFGLPGTSNNFTVNGEQENDPFLNLNNSGPTNLLLGQNDISSVNVLTSAYGAEFGSFGGAQINEISRSGNNKFHGDASYWWNGRDLNANNWFNKQGGNGRPFSNDNQWAASVGGPIIKDKTFFFFNWEGIRFITAPEDFVVVPSLSYQATIVGNDGACDNASSSLFVNGAQGECAFINKAFALYNAAPGASTAQPYDGDSNFFISTPKIFAKESLVTARVDQVLGAKDSAFAHFKYDNGTQPTYVDPISSVFNAQSPQPEYEGQFVETHTFTPNLVNQLLGTGAHYVAIFESVNQAAATAAFPYFLAFADESFYQLGGINLVFPQGRNATQYQIQDDLSWTKKNHTFKVGYAFKKDDITDFDQNTYTTTPEVVTFGNVDTENQIGLPPSYTLQGGGAYEYVQNFPPPPPPGYQLTRAPVGLYSEGFYVQDAYKPTSKILFTYGIRFEHNSNPVCPKSCFSRLNQGVDSYLASSVAADPTTAYNTLIAANQKTAFGSLQTLSYEPRIEFNYAITPKTELRGGFGIFSDIFPGTVADSLLGNIPADPGFTVYGPTLDPSLATSGETIAASSAAAFKSGPYSFANGGSNASLSANVNGFAAPNLTTPAAKVKDPTYEEYSLQIQRQLSNSMSFQIAYVGNHGYHEPVVDASRNASSASGFGGLPTAAPSQSFGAITQISSNADSNYNGVSVSIIRKSKIVTAQLNYTYSHALDQISNGGFLNFSTSAITGPLYPGTLKYNYGNADYDVRNSLNGNYIVDVPGYGGALLREITDGWQVAGTVFYRSGLPFTVTDSAVTGDFQDYGGAVPAQPIGTVNHHCSQTATTTPCLGGPGTSSFTDPTGFLVDQRNAYSGPHYFNTDLTLNKSFKLPYEGIRVILGANAYNILNHPNFLNPNSDISESTFGSITGTANVPTSIYGAGLGGDASVRIIQLHAKVSF